MTTCLLTWEGGQIFIHARIHACVNLGKVFVQYLDFTKNRCSGMPQRNGKRYLAMELALLVESFKALMMEFQRAEYEFVAAVSKFTSEFYSKIL